MKIESRKKNKIVNALFLSEKELEFCRVYTAPGEFFGNGTHAYLEAYKPDLTKKNWYANARQSAAQITKRQSICNRINELLDKGGLNNEFVDSQLLFVIQQHEDLAAKVAAIKEFNKLRQRIIDKQETTHILPQPILAGETKHVSTNNSDQQAIEAETED